MWHRPFAISSKSLASSALLYFQPFSSSIVADDEYYNHAGEQAARLLNLEALENADKYILLANAFLAWDLLKSENDDSHFPVDDLDSQTLATPQLARLVHAVREPVISALILSNLSTDLAAALLLGILNLGVSSGITSHAFTAAYVLCSLLLIPATGSRFGELLHMESLRTPALQSALLSFRATLVERPRTDGGSSTLDLLKRLGVPSKTSEAAELATATSSSLRSLASATSMDIDRSSAPSQAEAVVLPDALSIALACVECQLHDDSVSLCAWKSLSSAEGIDAAGGAERWCGLVESRLLPLFKSSSTFYSETSRIELLQIISDLQVENDRDRTLIAETFKALLVEDWNGTLTRDLLLWRLSNSPRLLSGGSLAKHGLTATLNSVSDSFDLDVARQLLWLSFVDPNALMRHLVSEMTLKKDVALRFGLYLAKLPTPLLPSPSNSLLLDSIKSIIGSMAPTSPTFKSHSSNLLQALSTLKQTKSDSFKVALLGPLTISHDICKPLLADLLAASSGERTKTNGLEPLPLSQFGLLNWILELILVDASALADFGIFLSNPSPASLALLELVLVCDARLQASVYASSSLPTLLDLTEKILRCFSSQGLDLRALRNESNSGAVRLHRSQLKCSWRTLLKCSSDALAVGRSLTERPPVGNSEGLSATAEKFLPVVITQFLASAPLSTLDTPSSVFDLVYTAALGGSIGAKVADRLQGTKLEASEKPRFLRHASVACALVLPRLSASSLESVFVNFLLPVATWIELRKMLEANRPATRVDPEGSSGTESVPPLDKHTKSIVAGNRSGDVAMEFSEIGSFLEAVSWLCDILAALICNKQGLSVACYGEGPIAEQKTDDGAVLGEAWLELVGKALNVAISFLGLGASTPLHSHPLPLLTLLHVLLHRLCIPLALEFPSELRTGQFSLDRLGIFFQMLTGETMPYSSKDVWSEQATILMRNIIKRDCSELERGWQPAGLCLGSLSVLWINDGHELK